MADDLFDLNGAVALVTGGNSGIGRGIALAYARAGASVSILGRNAEKNASVVKELRDLGCNSMALEVDVSDRSQLQSVVETVEAELGPLTILVNNAGTANRNGLLTLDLDDWDRVMETNLTSAVVLSKFAARSMVQRRAGKIINIASSSIFFGWSRSPAYAVSKAALVHLTKCVAVELAPFNVQVNAIAPGWVETDMIRHLKDTPFHDATLRVTPAGRWAQPEEMAGAAIYLASAASNFVTGTTLVVDGATTIAYGAATPERELPQFE